jgi:hypothetical protein
MLVTFAPRPATWFGLFSIPFWLAGSIGSGAVAFLVAKGESSPLVVIGTTTLLLTVTAIHLVSMGLLAEAAVEEEDAVGGADALPEAREL